jgi:hypothetical protein
MLPIETTWVDGIITLIYPKAFLLKHCAPLPRIDKALKTSNMTRPQLTVYLDVVSPFGYMAFYLTRVSVPGRLLICYYLEMIW